MADLIGFVAGLVAGGVQFWLLAKFTSLVSGEGLDSKALVYGIAQFCIPIGTLIAVALLQRQELLWTGVGIVGFLLFGAIVKVLTKTRAEGGGGPEND